MPSSDTKSGTRSYRPSVDRLEPLRLLSAGLSTPAQVHADKVVDLSGTQVARDITNAVAHSTVKFTRGKILLTGLTVDDSTRMIRGGTTATYKLGFLAKVTSNVAFQTSVDSPAPADVKTYLSKFNSFLSRKDRVKVANAVAQVLVKDHDLIIAAMKA